MAVAYRVSFIILEIKLWSIRIVPFTKRPNEITVFIEFSLPVEVSEGGE